jgi:hypothetical protein
MTAGAASAPFEATAIETTVAIDSVIAAEGGTTDRRALRICRARAAKGDVSTAEAASDRTTDAVTTIEPTAALGSRGAATTLIAAAVQRSVAGDPVVITEDRSPHLAAFARLGALPTEPDGSAATTRGSADSIRAKQPTTADSVTIAPTAVVMAAVQNPIRVDAV